MDQKSAHKENDKAQKVVHEHHDLWSSIVSKNLIPLHPLKCLNCNARYKYTK